MIAVEAEPYAFEFSPAACALLIIDMQRDFLEPGGFGEMLGNDISRLRPAIEPNRRLLGAWRARGWPVLHTREGHRPDLACLPPSKKMRGRGPATIGDLGPMGRILIRGEAGHDIIPELYPLPGEPVIDKPGKGAFYATDLHDRGYECLVPEDCVGSYFPEFQEAGLNMIKAQGGIFGWVSHSKHILAGLD